MNFSFRADGQERSGLPPVEIGAKPQSKAAMNKTERRILAGNIPKAEPNEAVRGTAARLRFGMNANGLVRAAARDGGR